MFWSVSGLSLIKEIFHLKNSTSLQFTSWYETENQHDYIFQYAITEKYFYILKLLFITLICMAFIIIVHQILILSSRVISFRQYIIKLICC